jgi:sulfate adenylyltransferase
VPVAILEFKEAYTISKKEHAQRVYGTEDAAHPGVAKLYGSTDTVVAGRLKEVVARQDNPFENLTLKPKETRLLFRERGWREVIAFQTDTVCRSDR